MERCLRLCQEYGIVDAAAFLLERVGDIGSALLLVISSLNEKFILLDTAVESKHSDAAPEHFKATLSKKEVFFLYYSFMIKVCLVRSSPSTSYFLAGHCHTRYFAHLYWTVPEKQPPIGP